MHREWTLRSGSVLSWSELAQVIEVECPFEVRTPKDDYVAKQDAERAVAVAILSLTAMPSEFALARGSGVFTEAAGSMGAVFMDLAEAASVALRAEVFADSAGRRLADRGRALPRSDQGSVPPRSAAGSQQRRDLVVLMKAHLVTETEAANDKLKVTRRSIQRAEQNAWTVSTEEARRGSHQGHS